MRRRKSILINSNGKLQLCILNNRDVDIFVAVFLDYFGKLVSFDNDTIEVTDGKYLRSNSSVFLGSSSLR